MHNFFYLIHNKNGDFMETNWIEVGDVVIRAIVSLFTLFLVTKLLGKTSIAA